MKMTNPIDRFENDLGRIVRRLSKSKGHDGAIAEVVGHFEDLYATAKASGLEESAESEARVRIGNLYKIAFQIVSSPTREAKGIRIQFWSIITFSITIIAYLVSLYFIEELARSGYLSSIVLASEVIFVLSGLSMGFGIFMSCKLNWRTILGNFVLLLVLSSGLIFQSARPDHMFHMSQAEAKEVVARQTAIEPMIHKVEKELRSQLAGRTLSSAEFQSANSLLKIAIATNDTYFVKVDASTPGRFLYPKEVTYPHDRTYYYRATLGQSDDLDYAKRQWDSNTPVASSLYFAMQARDDNFEAYRNYVKSRPVSWTFGFNMGAILTIGSTGAFLLLALSGYLLARVRILGFDWIPVARKA